MHGSRLEPVKAVGREFEVRFCLQFGCRRGWAVGKPGPGLLLGQVAGSLWAGEGVTT